MGVTKKTEQLKPVETKVEPPPKVSVIEPVKEAPKRTPIDARFKDPKSRKI